MRACYTFACLSFTLAAMGQRHTLSINYKPSLTYFGKQHQSFDNYYFVSRKGNQTFNNSADILYTYQVFPKISLTTGIEYSRQGQDVNFKTSNVVPQYKNEIFRTEFNYIRIPLTINYSILKGKDCGLLIHSGVSLGLVTKREDNYNDIINEYILLPPAEKRYKSKDWAIPIGIDCQKELSTKLFLNFGIEYLLGLTNAFSDGAHSKFGVLAEFDNSRQSRLSVNVGIGLVLTK